MENQGNLSRSQRRKQRKGQPRRRNANKQNPGKKAAAVPTVDHLNRTRCIYCCKDFTTAVAKKNKKFLDAKPTYSWHHVVISCTKCNSRFCKVCIRKLYGYASREGKQDPLLSQLKTICDNGPYDYVPEVIGFCCLIRTKKREYMAAQTPPEQGVHSRLRALVSSGVSLICGFLFLPALRVFLNSPNETIDIHGFGLMKDVADGLAHCCPSEATVVEMGEAGIFPRSFEEHPAWASKRRLVIPDFNYLGKQSNKRKVSNHSILPPHTY